MAKQQRALRTYEQTLDAAAAEIVRSGYSRTTLSAVVTRTGMTKGALYGHFSSKEALAAALIASARTACAQALTQATKDAHSAIDSLRLGVVCLLQQLDTDIRVRAALRLAVESSPEVAGADELLDRISTFIRRHATAAHLSGQLPRACAAEAITNLLLAVVLGYERLLDAPGLGLKSRELHDTQLFLDHLIQTVHPDRALRAGRVHPAEPAHDTEHARDTEPARDTERTRDTEPAEQGGLPAHLEQGVPGLPESEAVAVPLTE